MTRQQQNDIILSKIQTQLADGPDAQERILKAFGTWFRDLAARGAELTAQQSNSGGGGEAAPEEAAA